jgi:hypothetical protein
MEMHRFLAVLKPANLQTSDEIKEMQRYFLCYTLLDFFVIAVDVQQKPVPAPKFGRIRERRKT